MRKNFSSIFLLLFLLACANESEDKKVNVISNLSDTTSALKDTTIVLYMDLIDSSLKANVKMVEYKAKVRNVTNSIIKLSDISYKYGGYMSRDHTKSEKFYIKEQKIQEDTSQVLTYYRTKSTLMLRVPHRYMDSVLMEIDKDLSFVDYKFSRVNDSLISRYAANRFLNKGNLRINNNLESYSIGNISTSLGYEKLIEQYVNSYGAIILTIYQNPEVYIEKIEHKKLMPEYKPSFWSKTKLELSCGLEYVKLFWFILVRYWPIVSIAIIIAIIAWINYIASDNYFENKTRKDTPRN
jgi:hypothetical protein